MKSSSPIPFIIAALIVAGGAYWYFFLGDDTNEVPLTTEYQENAAQTRFKTLVSELSPISFKTDIFDNPKFMALESLATPVQTESSGRLDPFAPISGVSASSD